MAITRKELDALLTGPDASIERISTLSSDGQNLLLRVPREVVTFLELQQGDRLRWLVSTDKKIRVELAK